MLLPNPKEFSIDARTVVLSDNNYGSNNRSLLQKDVRYHIPIYQRPYSWKEKEIEKFISDIFLSFWGVDKKSAAEPIFIGTMQVSEKKSTREIGYYHDVIDGQQRLTTLLLLHKVLSIGFAEDIIAEPLDSSWLLTSVNNGVQQEQLKAVVLMKELDELSQDSVNPFIANSWLIKKLIDEIIKDGVESHFSVSDFLQHTCTRLYFVVIETRAPLSKTLQIFNAINTTGLDLNGSDIFKLRMFEYLKDRTPERDESEIFNEISALYERLESKKLEWADDRGINFDRVLRIYQYILIERHNLPFELYDFSTDNFFEQLFDTLFRSALHKHFRGLKDVDLSCLEMNKVIDVIIEWEELDFPTVEDKCVAGFIQHSRYGKFFIMRYIFLFRFENDPDRHDRLYMFLRALNKLYAIYSIIFQRRVYHIQTWSFHCIRILMTHSYEELLKNINNKIAGQNQYGQPIKQRLIDVLADEIVYNWRIKNFICRLSAMLDEQYTSSSPELIEEIFLKLFGESFDVEHIQSCNDEDKLKREEVSVEWGNELHALGNLVVLEAKINRSIGNKAFIVKRGFYKNSKYTSIKKLLDQFPTWGFNDALIRKDEESAKLVGYLCSQ